MKTVNDIRNEFTSYFVSKGHEHVPSSPLVPQNDPTLMFVNSGMVQFKNVFTGVEKRPYTRATTAQKSVRAGGKHNDLDNVGYTARHATFFEMLGNFSFGDYFKEEAINYAWELVTKNYGMSPDKLLVTVHHTDDQAAAIWKKVTGFNDSKIIRIHDKAPNKNDNFWMMGDFGPCGPCSEIFIDRGEHIFGGPPGSKDEDGDRFLEFWNLVFMQYEQEPDGNGGYKRVPLPKPSIDTGMGLERMATILQGVDTIFDIDLMRRIIEHVATLTGVDPNGPDAASHRVIADHLRCSSFLLADGVMPSNEGRGYVLRRIMRRGMRHAHILGAREPLMYKLVPTLIGMMGAAYPELKRAEALITETLRIEEERFRRTLEQGLKLLDAETAKLSAGQKLAGVTAFKLYDTFGFPVDLTQDALKARGLEVDMEGFEASMERQREDARKSWTGSGDTGTEKLWFELAGKLPATEFLGYEKESAEGQVLALVKDGKEVDKINAGDTARIIVNQSPFYAESGGQVGDTGTFSANGVSFTVTDVQKKLGRLWVHEGTLMKGSIAKGDSVEMKLDTGRRNAIRANHSATHLMHEALRQVLGEHVSQKGSRQDADRTRFDVSHPYAMTSEQVNQVEAIVNNEIRANNEVVTRLMGLEDAMQSGAMALFGEKYDDEVRVVSMGSQGAGNKTFSVELCGGTHTRRTGDIGLFKIVSEGGLSAGVRRLEALTGQNALRYFEEQDQRLQAVANALKSSPAEVLGRVEALAAEKKKLEQQLSDLRRQMATGGSAGGSADSQVKEVGGMKFTARVLEGFPAKDLKPMVDDLKSKLGSGVVALIATNEGKASIVVGVTDDLTSRISAVELVRVGAEAMGGKGGGGRPDMAQAGGPNAEAANDAVAAIEKALA